MESNMEGITITDLKKVYESDKQAVVAVEDLNITIDDGEFLVLVGPSGCGKSTTLRCIAGLEDVSEGSITFGETDVTDLRPSNRDVAMVFQNYALYPHMTVKQNIGFGLKLSTKLSSDEIDAKVESVAEMLGISELLGDKPKALSGGQQQRVALAGDRSRAVGLPHGRAAFESRCETPLGDANRTPRTPTGPCGHDSIRHSRSDRSDGDG